MLWGHGYESYLCLVLCLLKLEFHGTDTDTDTDTDILADFRARIVAMSACPATFPFSLPRAGHARRSSPTCPPTCPTRSLFLARILARMSVRDACVYTCKRVLYTIAVGVHVGVGPVEFQLNTPQLSPLPSYTHFTTNLFCGLLVIQWFLKF